MLLTFFSLIAGGSLEEMTWTIGIIAGVVVIAVIVIIVKAVVDGKKETKEGLEKAADQFGAYTHKIEYEHAKFVLYDEKTHRIMLKSAIMDSRKIRELKTKETAPQTKTTYKEEMVTKTSTGSAVGRGVVGALVAGPAGAIIGGATAKKTTEVQKTPEYHTIPGHYDLDVIDDTGAVRANFWTTDKARYDELKSFLESIIEENTRGERLAIEAAREEKQKTLESADCQGLVIGGGVNQIDKLLIDSDIIERSDSKQYKLCPKAVGIINRGWNSNFDRVQITVKEEVMKKLNGISKSYTAGGFNNLLLEISQLAQTIGASYGTPTSVASDITYTSFTDDNPVTHAYQWDLEGDLHHSIDVLLENGVYKYQLLLEKK